MKIHHVMRCVYWPLLISAIIAVRSDRRSYEQMWEIVNCNSNQSPEHEKESHRELRTGDLLFPGRSEVG